MFLVSLIFFGNCPIFSQTETTTDWPQVMQAYQDRSWKQVVLSLSQVVASETYSIENRRRAWFILGQSYLRMKAYDLAEQSFLEGQKLDKEYPLLWTYHLMRVYLRSDQQQKALPLIQKLLQPPVNGFYLRKIRANIKNYYNTNETLPLIHPVLKKSEATPSLFFNDHELINIYAKSSSLLKKTIPNSLYVRQWRRPENLALAKESDAKIAELKKAGKVKLTSNDYRTRYERLDKLRLYKYLTEVIPKQINQISDRNVRTKVSNIYLEALFKRKQYQKILTLRNKGTLAKTYNTLPTTQVFWTIRSQQRLRQITKAAESLKELEKIHPGSTWLPLAYRKMAESYEIIDNDPKADVYWKTLAKRFAGTKEAEVAFWKAAWFRYRNKRYKDALYYVDQAMTKQVLSPEVFAKFMYWQGKLQHLLGRNKQADQTFKTLQRDWPNTYYNLRFLSQPGPWTQKITTFGTKPPQRKFWHSDPPAPEGKMAKLTKRHEFLFALGEKEHAVYEVMRDIGNHGKYSLIWRGSELLYENQEHHSLQRLISNYYLVNLKKLPIQNQAAWKFAYPRAYWSFVKKQADKAGIDPYWALSIMREESRFDPEAKSIADAHGLMQLIPPTAKEVARQQKLKFHRVPQLYDPFFNIRLGTHYLGGLAKRFNQNIIFASGGYNAGPHNMKKWVKRDGKLPADEFVEMIPYRETRNYVKRVFMTYSLYKRVYGS